MTSSASRALRGSALVAVAFGLVTLMAGGRVWAGANPGYVVFFPLLAFNTCMGVAYVAVGVALWRGLAWASRGAAAIFGVNLAVWIAILALWAAGSAVAAESLGAMAFRTAVWAAIAHVARPRHP